MCPKWTQLDQNCACMYSYPTCPTSSSQNLIPVKKQYEEQQITNLLILLSPVHNSFMYIEFNYVFPV